MFRINSNDFRPNVSIVEEEARIWIHSYFYLYGDAASAEFIPMFIRNIQENWGRQDWEVVFERRPYFLHFDVDAELYLDVSPNEIRNNNSLRNIYIRLEYECQLNISFTDGMGANTGYFLVPNLIQAGSTTIAHEYGHLLGLWPGHPSGHPQDIDYRGRGMPGIMYPRGTLVDPQYQYDDTALPGKKGGTLNPKYREVKRSDVEMLVSLMRRVDESSAVLGGLSNRYHQKWEPLV